MWRRRRGLPVYHVGRSTFTSRSALELATDLSVVFTKFLLYYHIRFLESLNSDRETRGPSGLPADRGWDPRPSIRSSSIRACWRSFSNWPAITSCWCCCCKLPAVPSENRPLLAVGGFDLCGSAEVAGAEPCATSQEGARQALLKAMKQFYFKSYRGSCGLCYFGSESQIDLPIVQSDM